MLGESGQIYTVGKNVYGQLGDGTTIERTNISTVVRVKDGNTLKNINENCLIEEDLLRNEDYKKVEKYFNVKNYFESKGVNSTGKVKDYLAAVTS